MSPVNRPLAGLAVNLSISESEDATNQGFPLWQVNRVTLQAVAALFGQGASVVFGHDWRDDGVMEAVYGFARQMQPPVPLSPDEASAAGQPLLLNLLPWPDRPYLPEQQLERLASTLRVRPAGLPPELEAVDQAAQEAGRESDLFQYVRARGLTFLRHRLGESCHARLCLGGRRSRSSGRYPGVIEEALLALRSGKPLYLAAALGGATRQIIDAIERRHMPDDFCLPTRVTSLFADPPVRERDSATLGDRGVVDRAALWEELGDAGRQDALRNNGLSESENRELFHTPAIDRVIELALTGLSRLRSTTA